MAWSAFESKTARRVLKATRAVERQRMDLTPHRRKNKFWKDTKKPHFWVSQKDENTIEVHAGSLVVRTADAEYRVRMDVDSSILVSGKYEDVYTISGLGSDSEIFVTLEIDDSIAPTQLTPYANDTTWPANTDVFYSYRIVIARIESEPDSSVGKITKIEQYWDGGDMPWEPLGTLGSFFDYIPQGSSWSSSLYADTNKLEPLQWIDPTDAQGVFGVDRTAFLLDKGADYFIVRDADDGAEVKYVNLTTIANDLIASDGPWGPKPPWGTGYKSHHGLNMWDPVEEIAGTRQSQYDDHGCLERVDGESGHDDPYKLLVAGAPNSKSKADMYLRNSRSGSSAGSQANYLGSDLYVEDTAYIEGDGTIKATLADYTNNRAGYFIDGTRTTKICDSAQYGVHSTDGTRTAVLCDGTNSRAGWFIDGIGTAAICDSGNGWAGKFDAHTFYFYLCDHGAPGRAALFGDGTYGGYLADGAEAGFFTETGNSHSAYLATANEAGRFVNTDYVALLADANRQWAGHFTDGTRTVYLGSAVAAYATDGTNTVELADGTYAVNATAGGINIASSGNVYSHAGNLGVNTAQQVSLPLVGGGTLQAYVRGGILCVT